MASTVTEEQFVELAEGLDKAWIIICGGIIFSMQVGFALLEAGGVRKKNSHIVWHKLILNSLIVSFTWWLMGYAIAFGDADGSFIGGERFFAGSQWKESFGELPSQYGHWVFQVSICCVVVAITGGSVSERVTLKATCIHTFLMSCFIYPVVVSWTWGEGWLNKNFNYHDFTGSGIVHCTGAYAGLAGLLIVGPRYNKYGTFNKVLKDDEHKTERAPETYKSEGPAVITSVEDLMRFRKRVLEDEYEEFGVTNMSYTLFGALILWFQFIFFNAGSSIIIHNKDAWIAAEKGAQNTFMGGVGGGFVALALKHYIVSGGFKTPRKFRDDAATCANAFLGGMVANGAGMDTYEPWEALVVGCIAGLGYSIACWVFEKFHLDDALEAWQLHGMCGTIGVACEAFFNHNDGIYHGNDTSGKVLGRQLLGWVCISSWSFVLSFAIFWGCKAAGILRVDLKTEIIGYDFIDNAEHTSLPITNLKEKSNRASESVNYELARKTTDENVKN